MTDSRWKYLMEAPHSRLTNDELHEQWHFCPEFDGLLMLIGDPGCDCTPWTEEEIKEVGYDSRGISGVQF